MKKIVFVVSTVFLSALISSGQEVVVSNLSTVVTDLMLFDNHVYIAQSVRITKVDLAATTPTTENFIFEDLTAGMALKDGYLYLALLANDDQLVRYNFNDPSNGPVYLTEPEYGNWDLLFIGNILYYTDAFNDIIYMLDMSGNPDNPVKEVYYDGIDACRGMAVHDGFLYVAEWKVNGKIYKFDLTLENPVPIEVASGLNMPHDIAFKNQELYVSIEGEDRIVKSNADLVPLQFEDVISTTGPKSLLFDGDDLYFIFIGEGFSGLYDLARLDTSTLNLNKQELNQDLKLYPNPTAGGLNLNNLRTATEYSIYDIQGRLLKSGRAEPEIGLDVSAFSPGRYFLKLENGGFQSFLKK